MKLMLLCLLFAGCSSVNDDNGSVEKIVAGDYVPLFSVGVVDRGQLTTFSTEHLYGETVIVFFSTLCSDCQRELPELNEYYKRHQNDSGFRMVAISRGEDESMVAPFWEEYNLEIPYSAQPDWHIYNLFANSIVPRVYFVAPSGMVTKVLVENFDVGE